MVLSLMAHLKSPSDCQEGQYQKNQHLHHSLQPRHHTNEVRYVWSLTNYTKYVKSGLSPKNKSHSKMSERELDHAGKFC